MRIYDIIIIFKEDNWLILKKIFFYIKNIIFKNFCLILIFEKWGLKKLSYSIKGCNKGYYIYLHVKLDLKILNDLNFFLRSNIQILRFFVIKFKNYNSITYHIWRKIRIKTKKEKFNSKKKFFYFKKKIFFLKNNIYNLIKDEKNC